MDPDNQETQHPIYAMAPIIDTINADPLDRSGEWQISFEDAPQMKDKGTNRMVTFRTTSAWKAGDEILTSVSDCEHNMCFLLNHGFLPEENPRDHLPLSILTRVERKPADDELPEEEKSHQAMESWDLTHLDHWFRFCPQSRCLTPEIVLKKISLLKANNLQTVPLSLDSHADLMTAAHIILSSEKDLSNHLPQILSGETVEKKVRTAAKEAVTSLLVSALAAYDTTQGMQLRACRIQLKLSVLVFLGHNFPF